MKLLTVTRNRLYTYIKLLGLVDSRTKSMMNTLDKGLGHLNSYNSGKPIDNNNNPVPWFTYPAIAYLKQIDFKACSFLEWGAGYSTLFFAPLCKEILSIENNSEWYNIILDELPANSTVKLRTDSAYESYAREINKKFDVIIVDGIRRWECIQIAIEVLDEDGMIIFDNSDRDPEYCKFLREHDFIQVDFHGFGPINPYTWTTSIFFSRTNKLKPTTIQPVIHVGGGY